MSYIPKKGDKMVTISKFFTVDYDIEVGDKFTVKDVFLSKGSRRVNVDRFHLIDNLYISDITHEVQFDMNVDNGVRYEFTLEAPNRDKMRGNIFLLSDLNKIIITEEDFDILIDLQMDVLKFYS